MWLITFLTQFTYTNLSLLGGCDEFIILLWMDLYMDVRSTMSNHHRRVKQSGTSLLDVLHCAMYEHISHLGYLNTATPSWAELLLITVLSWAVKRLFQRMHPCLSQQKWYYNLEGLAWLFQEWCCQSVKVRFVKIFGHCPVTPIWALKCCATTDNHHCVEQSLAYYH